MSSRPLVFMWIAEYEDGTVFPQFDPKTGKENRFGDIDMTRLKRFGWHNFSPELARELFVKGVEVESTYPPISAVLELQRGEELVAVRRHTRKYGFSPMGRIYDRGESPIVYVLGVKDKAYIFIDEDGTIAMSTDFNYK